MSREEIVRSLLRSADEVLIELWRRRARKARELRRVEEDPWRDLGEAGA